MKSSISVAASAGSTRTTTGGATTGGSTTTGLGLAGATMPGTTATVAGAPGVVMADSGSRAGILGSRTNERGVARCDEWNRNAPVSLSTSRLDGEFAME